MCEKCNRLVTAMGNVAKAYDDVWMKSPDTDDTRMQTLSMIAATLQNILDEMGR